MYNTHIKSVCLLCANVKWPPFNVNLSGVVESSHVFWSISIRNHLWSIRGTQGWCECDQIPSMILCICGQWLNTWQHQFLDLEFKLVYVGSADDESYDQTLETLAVGPVPVGVSKFVFEVCIWYCSSSRITSGDVPPSTRPTHQTLNSYHRKILWESPFSCYPAVIWNENLYALDTMCDMITLIPCWRRIHPRQLNWIYWNEAYWILNLELRNLVFLGMLCLGFCD